jgi:ABC-type transport system substrate-binding protein
MVHRRLSRREFLRLAGMTTTSTMLVAYGALALAKDDAQSDQEHSAAAIVTLQEPAPPASAAPQEAQVVYETVAKPKHLDISRDIYNASAALGWGGEPLLRRDQNQKLVPALAESYTSSPNAEYFDFVIRKDAKWSDGVPITPDDFVFTFRHLADPTLDNPWTWFFYDIKGIKALKEGIGSPDDVGVEAVAARTVRIHGEGGPAPHIPALLAYLAASPVPMHKAAKNPQHWADTAESFVSSGPMTLVKWEHDRLLEWEINPYYNGPHKPGIQRLVQVVGTTDTVWFNSWGSVVRFSTSDHDARILDDQAEESAPHYHIGKDVTGGAASVID